MGCSTSEVAGERIGSFSSPELGQALFDGIYQAVKEVEVYLAAQCCEHLNRALILEEEARWRPDSTRLSSLSVKIWSRTSGGLAADQLPAGGIFSD